MGKKKTLRYGGKTYNCTKVKNKDMLVCSPKPKKHRTSHKGHRTKRGLAQDQRLRSKEKHEKSYRKKK